MANMSYCRFENTTSDLKDCYENMDDKEISVEEKTQRQHLIDMCCDIAIEYGHEIGREIEE